MAHVSKDDAGANSDRARMVRVLILSWYGPGRRDAGERIRLAEIAQALDASFDLRWCLIDSADEPFMGGQAADFCPPWSFTSYGISSADYLQASLLGRSIEAHRLGGHRALRDWVSSQVELINPDVIWVNQPFAWAVVPDRWRSRVILDTHNVNSARLRRISASTRWSPRKAMATLQAGLSRRFERQYVNDSAVTVAVSEPDAGLLSSLSVTRGKVAVLPNGANLVSGAVTSFVGLDEIPRVLFLGSLTYSANVEAIHRLADWLKLMRSSIRVTIAGSGHSGAVEKLCEQVPQFEFVGRVDDVRRTMEDHHALIATHSQGGGSRIKVLEALATRLPVIGTAVAVEGLGLVPGESYLNIESARDLDAAVGALRDREGIEALVENGWAIAHEHQWSVIGQAAVATVNGVALDASSRPVGEFS